MQSSPVVTYSLNKQLMSILFLAGDAAVGWTHKVSVSWHLMVWCGVVWCGRRKIILK